MTNQAAGGEKKGKMQLEDSESGREETCFLVAHGRSVEWLSL